MFIQNQSTEKYFEIIKRYKDKQISITKKSQLSFYTEKHHIIPKSLGGNNNLENIVFLLAEDHFICHKLLIDMTKDADKGKMWSGLWRMMNKQSRNQKRDFTFTEEEYKLARLNHSEEHSKRRLGDKNPFKNKKHSEQPRKIMSEAKKGKTWEEIYGIEGAAAKKLKTSISCSKPQGPQEKVTCFYCNKVGGKGIMKRWHGVRCKLKPNDIDYVD